MPRRVSERHLGDAGGVRQPVSKDQRCGVERHLQRLRVVLDELAHEPRGARLRIAHALVVVRDVGQRLLDAPRDLSSLDSMARRAA